MHSTFISARQQGLLVCLLSTAVSLMGSAESAGCSGIQGSTKGAWYTSSWLSPAAACPVRLCSERCLNQSSAGAVSVLAG